MDDDCRKRLTIFLGECWHEFELAFLGYGGSTSPATCKKCGKYVSDMDKCTWKDDPYFTQRTFTAESDMMALYRRLWENGKWDKFTLLVADMWRTNTSVEYEPRNIRKEFTAWLFCLSGEDYEQRCQMVADFLEVKDGK